MSIFIELFIISLLIAVTTSLVGVFLILRSGSLTAFALSHSILLGIVLAFMVTGDMNSPLLPVGAALTGLLIVTIVEFLSKNRFIKHDAALGVIYLFVFSLGLILVAQYAANTTLSAKAVVTGNIALVPFDRMIFFGRDIGPKLTWITILVLIINSLYIVFLFKELKITTLDPEYASILGINPTIINLSYMFVVSVTIVTSFSVAGIVVVVGLMIIPPSTAFILSKDLQRIFILTFILSIISAIIGFLIAWKIGYVEISSMITIISGILFILVLIIKPLYSGMRKEKSKGGVSA